jgi:hypothetical protein
MRKNIITIDIDTNREDIIKINKPSESYFKSDDLDTILIDDIDDLTLASMYMASRLSEENEIKVLELILNKIKTRLDGVTKANSDHDQESVD